MLSIQSHVVAGYVGESSFRVYLADLCQADCISSHIPRDTLQATRRRRSRCSCSGGKLTLP